MRTKITCGKADEQGWVNGQINSYRFQAKVYGEPSIYGINEGRISKLMVWDEAERQRTRNIFRAALMNYDRGWDIEPAPEYAALVEALISYLENFPASE